MAKKHMKKMLTISSYKGNANQNHTKISPHPYENSHHQKHHQQQVLARTWGKKKPSYTTGGNASWCNHSGKKFGSFLKI
jgi:hypothetical protein